MRLFIICVVEAAHFDKALFLVQWIVQLAERVAALEPADKEFKPLELSELRRIVERAFAIARVQQVGRIQ